MSGEGDHTRSIENTFEWQAQRQERVGRASRPGSKSQGRLSAGWMPECWTWTIGWLATEPLLAEAGQWAGARGSEALRGTRPYKERRGANVEIANVRRFGARRDR
jgi:hypothetical protein